MNYSEYFKGTVSFSSLLWRLDFFLVFGVCFAVYFPVLGFILEQTNDPENGPQIRYASLVSESLERTLVVEMSIAGILLLEFLIEIISSPLEKFRTKQNFVTFVTSIYQLIAALVIFFYIMPLNDSTLLGTLDSGRLSYLICIALCIAREYGKLMWNSNIFKILIFMVFIGFSLLIPARVGKASKEIQTSLYIVAMLILGFVCVVILFFSARWLLHLRGIQKTRPISKDEYHCTVYVVLMCLCILALWMNDIIFVGIMRNKERPIDYVITYEIVLIIFTTTLNLHRNRSLRAEFWKKEEELEFKRMFVRYISHEVRTPLNTAIMGLQLLLEELGAEGPERDEDLATVTDVKTSCDVAVNVLNELLTFDKLEGGTLVLEKSLVSAMEIIEKTFHPFQIQARKSKISMVLITNTIHSHLIKHAVIEADKHKIAQVLRNLISNGLKFTPRGGTVDVTVDVIEDTKGGVGAVLGAATEVSTPTPTASQRLVKFLKINVTDSGAGISAENQAQLFKEVVQFNPGKLQKGGGSGLGLYISHGIAKLHGGSLSVFSKGEGHGCTFTLLLPLASPTSGRLSRISRHQRNQRGCNAGAGSERVSSSRMIESPVRLSSQFLSSYYRQHSQNSGEPHAASTGLARSLRQAAENVMGVTVPSPLRVGVGSTDDLVDCQNEAASPAPNTNTNQNLRNWRRMMRRSTAAADYIGQEGPSQEASPSTHLRQQLMQDVHTTDHIVLDDLTGSAPMDMAQRDLIRSHDLVILVVDDSDISRKMQCRLLRRRFRMCVEAEDGEEAVNRIRVSMLQDNPANQIDIVIMDAVMPVMNGPDAARRMRDMGYRGIIVGLTGNVSTDDIDYFITYGADAVLPKPLEIGIFDQVVWEILTSFSYGATLDYVV